MILRSFFEIWIVGAREAIALTKDVPTIFSLLKKEIPSLTDDSALQFSKFFKDIDNVKDVDTAINRINFQLKQNKGIAEEPAGLLNKANTTEVAKAKAEVSPVQNKVSPQSQSVIPTGQKVSSSLPETVPDFVVKSKGAVTWYGQQTDGQERLLIVKVWMTHRLQEQLLVTLESTLSMAYS